MSILSRQDMAMLRQAIRNRWPLNDQRRKQAIQDLQHTILQSRKDSLRLQRAMETLELYKKTYG